MITYKGITYVGDYWNAKRFNLVDEEGFVICDLPMTSFHDAIEAYEDMFCKVIYHV